MIGIRSAVITLKHRDTPLRFVLFPMVHVAEPGFYDRVAAMAGACVLGRYRSPRRLPSLEQADEHDDRWDRRAGGRLRRITADLLLLTGTGS